MLIKMTNAKNETILAPHGDVLKHSIGFALFSPSLSAAKIFFIDNVIIFV